jgi:hypothetical protein
MNQQIERTVQAMLLAECTEEEIREAIKEYENEPLY